MDAGHPPPFPSLSTLGRARTVAIIQARLSSSRLPGKVLMDLGGDTLLSRVVRRTARARTLDQSVVATTTDPRDDAIITECARLGVLCLRGAEADVLDRYRDAATATDAQVVVRITADCPLIDPGLIDQVVDAFFHTHGADYASNTQFRTWPRGLDVEVFSRAALERAWVEAQEPWQRVHVTPYLYQHPELFRMHAVVAENKDHSDLRWTVDTPEDFALVQTLYRHLGNRDDFGWQEALTVVEREPELAGLNRHVRQKSLEEG
ncbi:spore coat polysaccharide biosynthesis protein SpsF [Gammaproteobacteria bacterium]